MKKAATIVMWVLTVLIALLFLAAGVPKVMRVPETVEMFSGWGYPEWFVLVIGVLEAGGAILLLIPRLALAAVGLLGVVMLGAAYTHVANGEGLQIIRPGIFLAVLLAIGWIRWTRRASAA